MKILNDWFSWIDEWLGLKFSDFSLGVLGGFHLRFGFSWTLIINTATFLIGRVFELNIRNSSLINEELVELSLKNQFPIWSSGRDIKNPLSIAPRSINKQKPILITKNQKSCKTRKQCLNIMRIFEWLYFSVLRNTKYLRAIIQKKIIDVNGCISGVLRRLFKQN